MDIQASDVLLITDVQNDFCPGGALPVPYGDEVIPVINRLAAAFQNVVLTQDWHPKGHLSFASSHPGRVPFDVIDLGGSQQTLWQDHCIQGTHGADFAKALHAPRAQLILRKGFRPRIDSYSAFQENDRSSKTGLASYLRERNLNRVFLAGLAYDYCVRASAADAHADGFPAIVIEDACRSIDRDHSHVSAREELFAKGVKHILSESVMVGHNWVGNK